MRRELDVMKKYCEECGKEVETKIVTKKETYKVLGESITVNAKVLVCTKCGEEFFSEEQDNETLIKAYNEYRKMHKLLLPEEIVEIREQYKLSQRSFAKLLNWGDKTIFRYENGSIQDKAHNSMLLFLREPENMRVYLDENEVNLSERQVSRLLAVIDNLESNNKSRMRFFDMLFTGKPSIENGYKSFDYDKFCAMVLFFANKNMELLKTKLMKLLNYSDMIYYKENGVSMSGVKYAHLPYGPVPNNFDILMGTMEADHIVRIEIYEDNGYEKHQVVAEKELSKGVLTKEEIEVLERIYTKFADFGSKDISNYSHKEEGYKSTKPGDIIPYSYAKYINL